MDINELKEWAETHDIVNRTIISFKKLLDYYELDDPIEYAEVMEGIEKEKLRYHVHTVSLNLGNWPECSYNTVSASMRVYFNERHFATYDIYFWFSGEYEDDIVDFL